MLFFSNKDPMVDFLELVKQANPEFAHLITVENLVAGDVVEIDPATNDGYNTLVTLHADAALNALGTVQLKFNRLDLAKAYEDGTVVVDVTTDASKMCNLEASEDYISQALGTQLTNSGDNPEFSADTSVDLSGVELVPSVIDFTTSLRYKPGELLVLLRSAGIDLKSLLPHGDLTLFVNNADELQWTDENAFLAEDPYVAGSGKISWRAKSFGMDFTSVWGNDPSSVIIPNTDPESALAYRFTDQAFTEINAILEAFGCPPLAAPYMAQHPYKYDNSAIYTANPNMTDGIACFKHTNMTENYFTANNIHTEMTQWDNFLVLPYEKY